MLCIYVIVATPSAVICFSPFLEHVLLRLFKPLGGRCYMVRIHVTRLLSKESNMMRTQDGAVRSENKSVVTEILN